jgi:hypothetical protein
MGVISSIDKWNDSKINNYDIYLTKKKHNTKVTEEYSVEYKVKEELEVDNLESFETALSFNRDSIGIKDLIYNENSINVNMNFNIEIDKHKEKKIVDNYIEKTRKKYFSKILDSQLKIPKGRLYNNIIIFDWDDTLMCTNYLKPNGITFLSSQFKEKLKELDFYSYNVLLKAINNGDTYIVTNAESSWVTYSANTYYPLTAKLLLNVKIISAREKFQKKYPTSSNEWKNQAFIEICKNYDNELLTNILSVGDSEFEMNAGLMIGKLFTQSYTKVIKFKENPSLDTLIKQLKLTHEQFDMALNSVKNLIIKVDTKRK